MKLKRLAKGVYLTLDGRYEIRQEESGAEDCSCPEHLCRHPFGEVTRLEWLVWDREADSGLGFWVDFPPSGKREFKTKADATAALAKLYIKETA